jgi:hypothetical protein
MSRQLRIDPANPIIPDRKICALKRLRFDKLEHRPIDDGPQRLHQVKNECGTILLMRMQVANRWIKP